MLRGGEGVLAPAGSLAKAIVGYGGYAEEVDKRAVWCDSIPKLRVVMFLQPL